MYAPRFPSSATVRILRKSWSQFYSFTPTSDVHFDVVGRRFAGGRSRSTRNGLGRQGRFCHVDLLRTSATFECRLRISKRKPKAKPDRRKAGAPLAKLRWKGVYRYDRFARPLRHLVNALEEFRALGIDRVSLHEGVDTSTPNLRLAFGNFASIAEFERQLIKSRVRSGLAAARAKGRTLGRPRVSVDVDKVAQLRASGVSRRGVSAQMGISTQTARRTYQKACARVLPRVSAGSGFTRQPLRMRVEQNADESIADSFQGQTRQTWISAPPTSALTR